MTALIPQLGLVATIGVGAVMIRLGFDRGLLRLRKSQRRCPACSRLFEGRVCDACTRGRR